MPAMILLFLSILGLVQAQNVTDAPTAVPVSTPAPVAPPTAAPVPPPTVAPTMQSVGPTTMAPTLMPTISSAPSPQPSESPTRLPTFESLLVQKENFRQEFVIIGPTEDEFFNETEEVLVEQV